MNIVVPDDLECVWVGVRRNISRNIKLLAFCTLYYPPEAPTHDALIDHITHNVDALRARYSNVGVVVMGDCNDLDTELLCNDLGLHCIVNRPTHRNSILDKVLTDLDNYSDFDLLPPLGLSIHKCVLVNTPARPPPPLYVTKLVRPWRDSSVREFGHWPLDYGI